MERGEEAIFAQKGIHMADIISSFIVEFIAAERCTTAFERFLSAAAVHIDAALLDGI